MEQKHPHGSAALIVGVSGMVGLSLAEALKKPTAPGGPWTVYGVARRPMPAWFPSSAVDSYLTLDAMNHDDTLRKLSPISHHVTHVFWVAIQVRQTEEANVEANTAMLANVLDALLASSRSTLRHVTLQTGTKHYMGPIFDPILKDQLVPHDPPFEEDMPRHPYPNFYYALEDLLASYSQKSSFSFSVHRSSIILGASPRSFYNMLLSLSAYAVICKHQGLAFRYPGSKYTWEHFCDASDSTVLAEQQIWAAVTDVAENQAFNCTNGDLFTWKRFWKELCEIFEVEFVAYQETEGWDWVGEMEKMGEVWDAIVEQHGLCKTKLNEITCFPAVNAVLHFEFQHVCSVNKSRDCGFTGHANTLKSLRMWVERLRKMKVLPPN